MFRIINKYLFLLVILPLFFTGCSDENENILLSNLFFGEEGEGIVFDGYEIAWDNSLSGSASNSNNGYINRGEQIYLIVRLKNTSDKKIENVWARLRTSSWFISDLTDGYVYYGDIDKHAIVESHDHYLTSGGQIYSYYSFYFKVENALPAGEDVTFSLDINVGSDLHNMIQFTPEIR